MGVPTQTAAALRDLERELARHKLYAGGGDSVRLAERIREVRGFLSGSDPQWIDTTKAKRLLGVGSESTVKAWARSGHLRSRTLPNGRLQVLLDDVLQERETREDLSAFGGDNLSHDELMHLLRPRLYPTPEMMNATPQRPR